MTSLQISDQSNQRCVTVQEIESFIDSLPSSYTSQRIVPSTKKHLRWKTLTLIGIVLCAILATISMLTGTLQILVVMSGSMQPALQTGDVIITMSTPSHALQINDIITYRSPDNTKYLVTHRVVNISQQNQNLLFQTKGDANNDPDHYIVPSEMIIGRMILVIPYFGFIVQVLHSLIGFFLFILIPGTIVIAAEALNIVKTIKIQNQTYKKNLFFSINNKPLKQILYQQLKQL